LSIAVVATDQLTKWIVRGRLPLGGSWPQHPVLGVFSFTHVANTGVAFGLFQGRSNAFLVLAAMVVVGLIAYANRLPGHARVIRLAVALQIGGAIGNVIDRLRLGHVTDFLKFHAWPVFNVADSAIVVGVLLLGWEMWMEERHRVPVEEPVATD